MVKLDPQDRATLVELLADCDELATETNRRDTLKAAGLAEFARKIDLAGSPSLAIGRLVEALATYGRRPEQPDVEVLGVFLNWVKTLVGVEQQATIAELMRKYGMMAPLANLPPVPKWGGKRSPDQIFEKIVGENTLRPIAFLQRGLELAHAVAYIGLPKQQGSGTGFLVAPGLLLTNYHVIGDRTTGEQSIFRFNFENAWDGSALPVKEYKAKSGGLFVQDEALDFTLIEIDGEPGAKWGWVPLVPGKVAVDERINIIQHPGGQAKQVAMQSNLVEYVDARVTQYVTTTMPGSSGSPAFNDSWEIVALHHAGGTLAEASTGRRHYRNEGVLVAAIVAALEANVRERVTTPVK